jgi:hypothetical protein
MVSIHNVGDMEAEVLLSAANPNRIQHLQHLGVLFFFRKPKATNLGISNGKLDSGALKYWTFTTKRATKIVEEALVAFNTRVRCVPLFV